MTAANIQDTCDHVRRGRARVLVRRPEPPPAIDAKSARALHDNFENWIGRVDTWLAEDTRLSPAVDRRRLARFVLTAMEGGLMQARAAGQLAPFDESVAVLRDYFDRLGAPASKPRRRSTVAPASKRSTR